MITVHEQFDEIFSDKDYKPTPKAQEFFDVLAIPCELPEVEEIAEYQEEFKF